MGVERWLAPDRAPRVHAAGDASPDALVPLPTKGEMEAGVAAYIGKR
jgi:hypothetical protein